VRWIFLSHDDHDHRGNPDPVLDLCRGATVVTDAAMVGRLIGDIELPSSARAGSTSANPSTSATGT
jgi:hypothetical protein